MILCHYYIRLSMETIPLQDAMEESKKIAEALSSLALAIVQAGAYIRETSCSLHDYLEIYETQKKCTTVPARASRHGLPVLYLHNVASVGRHD